MPSPTPAPSVHPSLVGYSPLLAKAASSLPPEYDFVSDGLSAGETDILNWADSRLFSNPSFLESRWGQGNWPVEVPDRPQIDSRFTRGSPLSDSELRLASAQAILLLMLEIDITNNPDGRHAVSWELDSLDRVLDRLEIYPGMCVHCYGKTGYDTYEGLAENYGVIVGEGHVHREMLKHFAYFAKADGEGILVRSLMDNGPGDFGLLYKRKLDAYFPNSVGTGSFAYENISFMSQIRLPDGTLESYPTMIFRMVANADTQRQAVERVYDFMRKNLTHFSGRIDDGWLPLFLPHTVTPYAPELGWILYVGEAGSPSVSAAITGAFRVLGLKAEQFLTPRKKIRAGSVEADGVNYFYSGNDPMNRNLKTGPIGRFFQTLEQVEDEEYYR